MEYFTTTEMAKKWSISPRRVALLCESKRLEGAIKKGKMWLIPEGTLKPLDARRKDVDKCLNVL